MCIALIRLSFILRTSLTTSGREVFQLPGMGIPASFNYFAPTCNHAVTFLLASALWSWPLSLISVPKNSGVRPHMESESREVLRAPCSPTTPSPLNLHLSRELKQPGGRFTLLGLEGGGCHNIWCLGSPPLLGAPPGVMADAVSPKSCLPQARVEGRCTQQLYACVSNSQKNL